MAEAVPIVPYGQGLIRRLDETALGTHGAAMDRLVGLGLPTVPGLTVPVAHAARLGEPAVAQAAVDLLQELSGRRVEDTDRPLLLRLHASATVPASGLPPVAAAIGVTAASLPRLAATIGRSGDVDDAWLGTVRLIAEDGLGVDRDAIEEAVFGVTDPGEQLSLVLKVCVDQGTPFPDGAAEQLALAARSLLARWTAPRAARARAAQQLPADLGIALHVQALRIGRWDRSGYGHAVSRNPVGGTFAVTGEFHRGERRSKPTGRQGEPLTAMPAGGDVLAQALRTLEVHLRSAAEVEFELRDGRLALLSATGMTRPSARAAVGVAVDLARSGAVDPRDAVAGVSPDQVEELLHPQLILDGTETPIAHGLPAAPGAATGAIALSSVRALELVESGVATILVAVETSPADVPALLAATAVVTTRGGLASHAAVVARGAGRPAVCSAGLEVDVAAAAVRAGEVTLREGDLLSLDGRTGALYAGRLEIREPAPTAELEQLLGWADDGRRLGVRANADNPADAATAFALGAEGIGLCRTEHQFLGDRLPLVRQLLLAGDATAEREALDGLAAAQQEDFTALLRVVGDRPVTVRLLDAPLHEFLPHDPTDPAVRARVESLREANPMLGLRGVRLAVLRPELYPAQVRALLLAWQTVASDGVRPQLEIMIPLVSLVSELAVAAAQVRGAAAALGAETGLEVPYALGTMVETPRAALLAGALTADAEFLSFGTNDLTQMTYGFSRDDVERSVLTAYQEQGLLEASPFSVLDADGVGALIALAVERARAARPEVKLGICGEHGGDPASIAVVDALGLDYVSCSARRVPVARLAAAHAAASAPAAPA